MRGNNFLLSSVIIIMHEWQNLTSFPVFIILCIFFCACLRRSNSSLSASIIDMTYILILLCAWWEATIFFFPKQYYHQHFLLCLSNENQSFIFVWTLTTSTFIAACLMESNNFSPVNIIVMSRLQYRKGVDLQPDIIRNICQRYPHVSLCHVVKVIDGLIMVSGKVAPFYFFLVKLWPMWI